MSAVLPDLTVLLCRGPRAPAPEWAWGQRLCEELLRGSGEDLCLIVLENAHSFTVSTALQATRSAFIGLVLDDDLFWGPAGWKTLRQVLASSPHVGTVGPVSNEAAIPEQGVTPPFPYQTPSLLHLACRERLHLYRGQWQEVPTLDPFAFLVRRADLEGLDLNLSLAEVPAGLSRQGRVSAVALDTYVHRYPQVYEQPRTDLQARVPDEARLLLDVGCAAGAFGAALKTRQRCRVIGIEIDPALAKVATERLDRVLVDDVEALPLATFAEEFDCIVCGDVLEHLRDPWATVAKLVAWLKPGGRLVATLPNVGHWSIVADLLRGRWELIPFGLLCWGHLRFFTRAGIERLFAGHRLTLELLQGLTVELPPLGEQFCRQAVTLMPDVDQEGLRTVEFLVVARKSGQ